MVRGRISVYGVGSWHVWKGSIRGTCCFIDEESVLNWASLFTPQPVETCWHIKHSNDHLDSYSLPLIIAFTLLIYIESYMAS